MRRYLRSQTWFEAMNVVLAPAVCVSVATSREHQPGAGTALGLLPTSLFLAEGTLFWWMKWRASRGLPVPNASRYGRIHDRFFWFNLAVLAATAAGIASLVVRTGGTMRPDLWWGVGTWLFAAAEHVNYFHWQLMHQRLADFRWVARHGRLKRGAAWRERHGSSAAGRGESATGS